ncbi:amidohydrolase family protein [Acuticoccus sp. I52.16.1]|uniref:amidohydrolase family protein n=1 Tax=Acuticoccus sp. I52.16.1 TaxID=2928472 RepID=UPI001FD5FCFC|nr:amidohydrolase family protein [Acuticoccus sp. I52.16.1]UOM37246.1 amidohydrolase family protein [Acuticoccus sp. I52.16.1]
MPARAPFDLIVRGGRVVDPETGFDAVADVGVAGGRIAAIGALAGASAGASEIDAAGRIVCPGFVDLHAHGQTIAADRMQAFDGVTTTLELEVGALPVAEWYDAQAAGGRTLHYGAAVSWISARKAVMAGLTPDPALHPMEMMGQGAADEGGWSSRAATPDEVERIVALVREGLAAGGVGVGIPHGYAPGAGVKEMSRLCDVAAGAGVPTFTHIPWMSNVDPQSSEESYLRIIGYAAATGAHMHICHLNSTSLQDIARCRELLLEAQAMGLAITVEAYPYGTGSTVLSAAFFAAPDFSARTGTDYRSIGLIRTGRQLADRAELMAAREEEPGALIAWQFLDVADNAAHRDLLDLSVLFPGGAIASDAMPFVAPDGAIYRDAAWPLPEDLSAHPRSAGTFTRFLSHYCFERRAVDLREALAKCTIIPAAILEGGLPQMRRKARLQVGCDADVVVFDPETLADRATFADMTAPSRGVEALLVGGIPVIADGRLDPAARPGRAMRREGAAG